MGDTDLRLEAIAVIVKRSMTPIPPTDRSTAPRARTLTERDAIDIWIARWLRLRRKEILERYDCDPRRLYDIWEGTRFPASRAKAKEAFAERYPSLVDRVDYGNHRRIPRRPPPELQPGLFDALDGGSTAKPRRHGD